MLWREGVELAFWDPWGIGQHCDVLADQPPAHRHIQGRAEYRAVVGHAARGASYCETVIHHAIDVVRSELREEDVPDRGL